MKNQKKYNWSVVVKYENVLGLFKSDKTPSEFINIGGIAYKLKSKNSTKRIAIYEQINTSF